jgi:hypothetical protein
MLDLAEMLAAAEREAQALRRAGERPWQYELPVDHLGFAVPPAGLAPALNAWRMLGYLVAEHDLVLGQKAWATMLRPDGNPDSPGPGLELVIPALELESPEAAAAFEAGESVPGLSAIAQYLVRYRPGMHHLAFAVEAGTIHDFRAHVIEAGAEVIGDAVRPGAFGTTVFFTKPDRGSRVQPGPSVLIEYVYTIGVEAGRQRQTAGG